ncbi:EAL domain-containing protein [Azorhizobium doebereinerae]|uniref:EAL domain-containing protein n=1 Tax=Azorhizobium doebereinerae TaxID=281091 RepID=UPI001FD88365|nr:EAL domain-containing protein [Azorhizobium doebereinerae]
MDWQRMVRVGTRRKAEETQGAAPARTGPHRKREEPGTAFSMAFQPIVAPQTGEIWGYEALVRGEAGESAASVLAQVEDEALYRFDQACRERAIEMAGTLFPHPRVRLSINIMPNAVQEPGAFIPATLAAARRAGLRPEQLTLEFTETERFVNTGLTNSILSHYRDLGMMTALDDFGSGYSGLLRLAALHPDLLKIDMALIRDIDADQRRQAIVGAILGLARALGIAVIAEGVQTAAEYRTLSEMGVQLFQGFYFACPKIGALPPVRL